jgi:DNA-binding transcriptional MerR regulator
MAKGEAKVSEDKLQALIDGWDKKDISELAKALGAKESTINFWAGKLRKSMKVHGMSDEQIKKILPTKRKVQSNVFDTVVKKMLSSEQAPKRRGRKPREVEGPVE